MQGEGAFFIDLNLSLSVVISKTSKQAKTTGVERPSRITVSRRKVPNNSLGDFSEPKKQGLNDFGRWCDGFKVPRKVVNV